MTRFDIDMGKCMYCGICVESCPIRRAGARRRRADQVHPHDARVRGRDAASSRRSPSASSARATSWCRSSRRRARSPPTQACAARSPATCATTRRRYNPPAFTLGSSRRASKGGVDEIVKDESSAPRRRARAAGQGRQRRQERSRPPVRQALAQTDCEACGWPTCRAYADALIAGGRDPSFKCEPGGAQSTARHEPDLPDPPRQAPDDAAKARRRCHARAPRS